MPQRQNRTRVMFVAYEPFETKFGSRLLSDLQAQGLGVGHLVVADPFQVRTQGHKTRLQKELSRLPFGSTVIYGDLERWQKKIKASKRRQASESPEDFAKRLGLAEIRRIIESDLLLNPMERTPYYPPLSACQIDEIAVSTMKAVVRAVEKFKPNVVCFLEDNYFVKNFLGELTRSHGFELRLIRSTRLGSKKRVDTALLPETLDDFWPPVRKLEVPADLRVPWGPMYESQSQLTKRFIQRAKTRPAQATAAIFKKLLRQQSQKLRTGALIRQLRRPQTRFYSSSAIRVHLFLFICALRELRYIWFSHFFFSPSAPTTKPYFVIPLHNRPESSVLSQSGGITDEVLIGKVLEATRPLKVSPCIVVLENPDMIELRPWQFYRKLREQPNLLLVDPAVDTTSIIAGAKGVLTVAGTAALEATRMGLPALVVGHPDYRPFVVKHGLERIESFIETCLGEEARASDWVDYRRFYAHSMNYGRDLGLDWGLFKDERRMRLVVNEVLAMCFR